LVLTIILWGTSFSFIKLFVEEISGFSYTFYRGLISILILTILLAAKHARQGIDAKSFIKGLYTGVTYTTGFLSTGVGDAARNAFNECFHNRVEHCSRALICRISSEEVRFSSRYFTCFSDILLVYFDKPQNSLRLGENLVFMGSISWATDIILVSKYSGSRM